MDIPQISSLEPHRLPLSLYVLCFSSVLFGPYLSEYLSTGKLLNPGNLPYHLGAVIGFLPALSYVSTNSYLLYYK